MGQQGHKSLRVKQGAIESFDPHPPQRSLIVFDGTAWLIRNVRLIEYDLDRDERVYRCDKHLGGPFETLAGAVWGAKCASRLGSFFEGGGRNAKAKSWVRFQLL